MIDLMSSDAQLRKASGEITIVGSLSLHFSMSSA